MGRLIDVDSLILEQQSLEDVGQGIMEFYSKEQIDNAPTVEAIPKADYEEQIKINNKLVNDNELLRAHVTMMQADYKYRLKADMVAMLTELKSEINPIKECEQQIYGKDSWGFVGKCQDTIQQKIDKLEENEDGKNDD